MLFALCIGMKTKTIKQKGNNMRQLGYMGVDQYGNTYHLDKHPRKELIEKIGGGRVSKMYQDTKDGKTMHVGYVIGRHWVDVYRVCQWKEAY